MSAIRRTGLALGWVFVGVACGSPPVTDAASAVVAIEVSPPIASRIAPLPPPALPIEEALARWIARAGAITVHVDGADGERRGSGSIVSRDGHVLTAAHVVEGVSSPRIVWPDGTTSDARVLARDDLRDLALLETGHTASTCVPLASDEPPLGAWVLLSGFPGALSGAIPATSSVGLVIGIDALPTHPEHPHQVRRALLTSARDAPGMSGGPTLDANGDLVGLVAATGARVAPIAAWSPMASFSCADAIEAIDLGDVALDPEHHEPARDQTLTSRFVEPPIERSGPERMAHPSTVRFHVSMGDRIDGVVVAPGIVLTVADRGLGTIESPNTSVTVPSHPSARVVGPVAIDGELVLVRVDGLDAAPLEPVFVAPPIAGALVRGAALESPGIVSAIDVVPGLVAPYFPPTTGYHRCGTILAMRRAGSPEVTIDHPVLALDAATMRGELVVDVRGTPIAIAVGSHVSGLGYAVRLDAALARFRAVLAPGP